MKKLATVLALSLFSAALSAGDLGFIAKIGSTVSEDENSRSSIMLTTQVNDCQHCITGSFAHLDGHVSDSVSDGVGVDYLYKIPYPSSRWYYITGGAYAFNQPINDQANNLSYHAGAGMDLGGFVLAVDVFGNPFEGNDKWSPITLFSAGWHF